MGGISMATSDQVKSLIKAHLDGDDEKFKTVVLQIASYEAKLNHDIIARDLKNLVNSSISKKPVLGMYQPNPLLSMSMPSAKLSDLIVSEKTYEIIKRILAEFHNRNKLKHYGMCNRKKILIEGKPGTGKPRALIQMATGAGKTFTASIIASELGLPLFTVQMDKLVTKFMGETSAKLRQIFDSIDNTLGVYLFDEFDAIGADRSLDNDVGEMRRVLNAFLQFIELDSSDSIIIAATNNQQLLDQALFRRFDDVLHYSMPSLKEIEKLYLSRLSVYQKDFTPTEEMIDISKSLSHAEIIRVCNEAIKESILFDKTISSSNIIELVNERLNIYNSEEA